MGLGGLSIDNDTSHPHTHKIFLITNYILLGAASDCIFLTLSLRLFPSLIGFILILLHLITIFSAVAGCAAASRSSNKFYGAHMVATVLRPIFQGYVSVLIFSRPFRREVEIIRKGREEDGVVILKLAGGLCVAIFC